MNPLIAYLLDYLAGVFVMAIITRYENAKEKSLDPSFSLLSWIGVAIYVICTLEESYKNGFIAKLLNYTDKE